MDIGNTILPHYYTMDTISYVIEVLGKNAFNLLGKVDRTDWCFLYVLTSLFLALYFCTVRSFVWGVLFVCRIEVSNCIFSNWWCNSKVIEMNYEKLFLAKKVICSRKALMRGVKVKEILLFTMNLNETVGDEKLNAIMKERGRRFTGELLSNWKAPCNLLCSLYLVR